MTTSGPRPPGTPGDPFDVGLGDTPRTTAGGAPGGAVSPRSAGPAAGPTSPTPPARHTGRTIGRTLALALLIAVTVVLVLFVVSNTQTVDIDLVFGTVTAPLVLALASAAVLGGLVVALAGATRRARRRNR
ncbi:MAG: DUF1049 domain-containing protein [Geodermatophilales bacterium]|nr:DUF1049 domain-containing protein [Geodermatophilales bacterium]